MKENKKSEQEPEPCQNGTVPQHCCWQLHESGNCVVGWLFCSVALSTAIRSVHKNLRCTWTGCLTSLLRVHRMFTKERNGRSCFMRCRFTNIYCALLDCIAMNIAVCTVLWGATEVHRQVPRMFAFWPGCRERIPRIQRMFNTKIRCAC